MTKSILIDTDMAIDDWMAICLLLQHSNIDVRAITVAADTQASSDAGVRNAMDLCMLCGKPDIPVAAGTPMKIRDASAAMPGWRDRVDSVLGITLPANPNPPSPLHAVELLRQAIGDAPEPPTLLTLAPLTNIAELLRVDPVAARRIASTTIMGGALDVPGNLDAGFATDNESAEWNIYVDPPAAAAVIASGMPATMIPLDATNDALLTQRFYIAIEADRTTPAAEFVYQVLTREHEFLDSGAWYFWDPLAAATIVDPTIVSVKRVPVSVVTTIGREAGRTKWDDEGTPIDVAVSADAPRFEQLFRDALNRRH